MARRPIRRVPAWELRQIFRGARSTRFTVLGLPICFGALIISLFPLIACSGNDKSPTGGTDVSGPLALTIGLDGPKAEITGRLMITTSCTYIVEDGISRGRRWFLAWPAEGTSWSGGSIEYRPEDAAEPTVLRNGDTVSLGGGGSSTSEGGTSFSEWVDAGQWKVTPSARCASDLRWSISSVTVR